MSQASSSYLGYLAFDAKEPSNDEVVNGTWGYFP